MTLKRPSLTSPSTFRVLSIDETSGILLAPEVTAGCSEFENQFNEPIVDLDRWFIHSHLDLLFWDVVQRWIHGLDS